MRFLVDAHHVGARQTGNETWIRNISRELVAIADPDELEFAASAAGEAELRALVGRAPRLVSSSAVRRLAFDLPRIARQLSVDATLVQYTMPVSRVPAVVMVHDTSFEEADAGRWMPARTATRIRWSVRTSARRAAFLLAPSQFTKSCLIRAYGLAPERIFVATNAVDPDLAVLLDKSPRSTRELSKFRVLAVGNVVPRKNLRTLAVAVSQLRASGLDATLRIVGSVPQSAAHLELEIHELLGAAVSFTGYVDDAVLADEYHAASVLGFPSLFEGFGIPALEAMYAGTPVVVSDSTSLPEVVGDAGVVVPATDATAWATALQRIHDDPNWATELRARSRHRASQYRWRSSAEAVLEALRAAANLRGRRR